MSKFELLSFKDLVLGFLTCCTTDILWLLFLDTALKGPKRSHQSCNVGSNFVTERLEPLMTGLRDKTSVKYTIMVWW